MSSSFQTSGKPLAIDFRGIDFIPQAILRASVTYLAARLGQQPVHACDDLDEFEGFSFFSTFIKSAVAVRHYAGHPDGTASVYLPYEIREVDRITSMIRALTEEFGLTPEDIIWERRDDPAL